jgi:hypothetical protein
MLEHESQPPGKIGQPDEYGKLQRELEQLRLKLWQAVMQHLRIKQNIKESHVLVPKLGFSLKHGFYRRGNLAGALASAYHIDVGETGNLYDVLGSLKDDHLVERQARLDSIKGALSEMNLLNSEVQAANSRSWTDFLLDERALAFSRCGGVAVRLKLRLALATAQDAVRLNGKAGRPQWRQWRPAVTCALPRTRLTRHLHLPVPAHYSDLPLRVPPPYPPSVSPLAPSPPPRPSSSQLPAG